jgi:hypothetical protein
MGLPLRSTIETAIGSLWQMNPEGLAAQRALLYQLRKDFSDCNRLYNRYSALLNILHIVFQSL